MTDEIDDIDDFGLDDMLSDDDVLGGFDEDEGLDVNATDDDEETSMTDTPPVNIKEPATKPTVTSEPAPSKTQPKQKKQKNRPFDADEFLNKCRDMGVFASLDTPYAVPSGEKPLRGTYSAKDGVTKQYVANVISLAKQETSEAPVARLIDFAIDYTVRHYFETDGKDKKANKTHDVNGKASSAQSPSAQSQPNVVTHIPDDMSKRLDGISKRLDVISRSIATSKAGNDASAKRIDDAVSRLTSISASHPQGDVKMEIAPSDKLAGDIAVIKQQVEDVHEYSKGTNSMVGNDFQQAITRLQETLDACSSTVQGISDALGVGTFDDVDMGDWSASHVEHQAPYVASPQDEYSGQEDTQETTYPSQPSQDAYPAPSSSSYPVFQEDDPSPSPDPVPLTPVTPSSSSYARDNVEPIGDLSKFEADFDAAVRSLLDDAAGMQVSLGDLSDGTEPEPSSSYPSQYGNEDTQASFTELLRSTTALIQDQDEDEPSDDDFFEAFDDEPISDIDTSSFDGSDADVVSDDDFDVEDDDAGADSLEDGNGEVSMSDLAEAPDIVIPASNRQESEDTGSDITIPARKSRRKSRGGWR